MLVDLRELEAGSTLEADLCIIGAGPAGISLALEFADTPTSVLLLESGGLDFEGDTQALAGGANLGIPYWDLEVARLRCLGGGSNHWKNWCGDLSAMDLGRRPWVPDSGWPIGPAELAPCYERARPRVGLGPKRPDAWIWSRMHADPILFDPSLLTHRFWNKREGRWQLGKVYRRDLERSRNIRVLLHANAANLQADPSCRHVEHVDLRTLEGRIATARACCWPRTRSRRRAWATGMTSWAGTSWSIRTPSPAPSPPPTRTRC